jgi:hypothetical protein
MTLNTTAGDYADCAAVYVATGQRFVDEAMQSARSLRTQMPELKIILHSDVAGPLPLFDRVEALQNPKYAEIDKVDCYRNVQEPQLLFLDTDTYVAEPLFDVFDLLRRFDLVVCHAPWRLSWDRKTKTPWRIDGVPDAFGEPNTGVVGFRNIPAVHQMFTRWRELFDEHKRSGNVMHDQPAFRQSLWESQLSFYVMPPEYNCRLVFPTYINGSVKIIHARRSNMEGLARTLNEDDGHKIFDPYSGRVLKDATFRKLNRGVRKVLFKWLQ